MCGLTSESVQSKERLKQRTESFKLKRQQLRDMQSSGVKVTAHQRYAVAAPETAVAGAACSENLRCPNVPLTRSVRKFLLTKRRVRRSGVPACSMPHKEMRYPAKSPQQVLFGRNFQKPLPMARHRHKIHRKITFKHLTPHHTKTTTHDA